MRILVFSDSHGTAYYMRQALLMHPEADRVVFLGDGERDLDLIRSELGPRPVTAVCGNCDFYSDLPKNEILKAAGRSILCTHGHLEGVKHGEMMLISKARDMKMDIVLYGHTHFQKSSYEDGLYIMNPGCAADGYYGMVDITQSGIMTLTCRVER